MYGGAAVLDRELVFARALADRAAEIALPLFERGPEVRLKPDASPVTEADLRIERMVRDELARRFPADAVLGEEGGGSLGPGRVWIVDPIDATRNFARGLQVWGTLLALAIDGEPVLGLVSAPALGERYEAVRGEGASLNGAPIHVSEVTALADATLCHYETKLWLGRPELRDALLGLVAEADRSVGFTDFWGHCLVARGSIEAMLEPSLHVWDWAPLKVLVEEAGGSMTAFDGGPCVEGGSILSTNGRLHRTIVESL